MMKLFLVLILSFGFLRVRGNEGGEDFIYSAVAPARILPNSKIDVVTTLHKAESFPVKVELQIEDAKGQSLAKGETSFTSLEKQDVSIQVPPGPLVEDVYNLTIKVSSSKGKAVTDKVLLQKEKKDRAILIQTDKPVYKPGETVKFRLFLVNRFFQPLEKSRSIAITILDPQRNVIKSYPKSAPVEIPASRGFVSKELKLSKEPNLGKWSIEVEDVDGEADQSSLQFDVDEYVLPKYKIDLSLSPTYVTYNDSKTTLQIKTEYTHGKPVLATCTATLNEPNAYYLPEGRVPSISKTSETSAKGITHLEFDLKKELNLQRDEIQKWGKSFTFSVSCKDSASGNVKNSSTSLSMYQLPYKVEIVERPSNIRPGFPLNLTLKLTMQDGTPFGDERKDAVKVEHGFSFEKEGGVLHTSVPSNGLITLNFVAPTNPKICYEAVDITYKEFRDSFWLPSKQVNPSGSYIQLTLLSKEVRDGEEVKIGVKTSKPMRELLALVLARGTVLKAQAIPVQGKMDTEISVKLPELGASPKTNILAYTTFEESGDLIADQVKLDVLPKKEREVEVKVEPGTQEPGKNVTITLKGPEAKNSVFGVRAVDQSVLLLRSDNDITNDKLGQVANSFRSRARYWGGSDVFQQFVDNGLVIMTNAKLGRGNMDLPYPALGAAPAALPMYSKISQQSAENQLDMASVSGSAGFAARPGSGGRRQPVRVRTNFPETWIFEDFDAAGSQLILHKTVPDTITSWILSAFQIDSQNGISLSSTPGKLTVFRPFFISLNLPYSIIRGEILALQVLVHNYQDRKVEATVTLDNDDGFFKFVEENEVSASSMEKKIEIEADSIGSVIFPIVPVKHGVMRAKVKAITDSAGDGVERTLIVRPPGIKHVQNHAILIRDTKEKQEMKAAFPENRVTDADSLKVQVIGDIMGGTMQNINNLIRLPSGCGEQNMVNFVPSIVVLEYLNKTGELTDEVGIRAKRFLERGYQQQLTYLRSDGSFSAFGNSDPVGSTWLTAFVSRSLLQAGKWVTIDSGVISRSLHFLSRMQDDDGSFSEEGFVHDRSLQGGNKKDNRVALTAFTLLAFAEADQEEYSSLNVSSILNNGIRYITSAGKLDTKDPYALSLVTYLLHVVGDSRKDQYFKMLQDIQRENTKEGTVHWEQIQKQKAEGNNTKPLPIWRGVEAGYFDRPATVEITAYALLTHLLRKDLDPSFKITKWLLLRRNSQGGFISTQDTVVGLTALGKLAEVIAVKDVNMEVGLSWPTDKQHTFTVNGANKMEVQEFILPDNVREVSISSKGKGTSLAQLSWTYYIEEVEKEPAFKLTTEVTDADKGRTLTMHICTSYLRSGEKSNMALLQANTPSGYAFDIDELDVLKKSGILKRYELEDKDSKVSIYFDSIESDGDICLNLKAYRLFLVAKHKPGEVSVIDYYDNTQKASVLYAVPAISLCDICKMEDAKCGEIKECKE